MVSSIRLAAGTLAFRTDQRSASVSELNDDRIILQVKVHIGGRPRFIETTKIAVMFVDAVHLSTVQKPSKINRQPRHSEKNDFLR